MKICVFCGSSAGNDPAYVDAARATGALIGREGCELVYGGARVGLMGAVADAALAGGARVTGVMPRDLAEKELAHNGLSELVIVGSMHERKTMMADLSDGFLALPGGAGTLEEIFEQWTWAQLGIHGKPCGFLNVNGYYDELAAMTGKCAREGFMRQDHADMLIFRPSAREILDAFRSYVAPPRKWILEKPPAR